ncbi:translation initiation factor IF-2-like [Synchiropus splendidus]|uniref:translation initiation factor IF-2-like n=1 Tax=Synchiropus splendidus TaxID=270530 RepID=UPI00237E71D3|nr:translation initiation factor IF-2-like [Synchiropus splendidus]
MGCFILGPGGKVIPLSLYEEHRSTSVEDEGSVGSSRQVQSEEEETFPWMVVLQPDKSLSEMKATLSEVSAEEYMNKESVHMAPLLEAVELTPSAADVHEEEGKQIPNSQHHEQDVESRFQQAGWKETSVKENTEKPGKSESQAGTVEQEEPVDPDDGPKKWSRDSDSRRLNNEEDTDATREELEANEKLWEMVGEMRQQAEGETQPLRNQKTDRRPEKETFVLPAPTEKMVSKQGLTPGDTGPEKQEPRGRRLERKPRGETEDFIS